MSDLARPFKVTFAHPQNGYDSDKEHAAKHLTVGDQYTVVWREIGNWHTTYKLQEVPGEQFNSVLFEDVRS